MSQVMVFRQATEKRHEPSKFLTLPPELRNTIYSMAFKAEDPSSTSCTTAPKLEAPPLLMSCRQIYNDAHLLFYAATTFRCTLGDKVAQWLADIPEPNRIEIRKAQVFVPLALWQMQSQHHSLSDMAAALQKMVSALNLSVRHLMREDFRFEINVWVNPHVANEDDWENLLCKGRWVGGETEEDLSAVWTCDPQKTVAEELAKRDEVREHLILKKREEDGRERLDALWG